MPQSGFSERYAMGCTIIGCGKALPALEVANDDLTALVDTSDEWITSRTGIKTRRICVDETNVDLAEAAARRALGWEAGDYNERRIDPEEIDLVIFSTATPDVMVPTCAALLRRRLGLTNAVAFDMNAACTGFIYGLTIAESMMAASAAGTEGASRRNAFRRALVVGGERLTRITNWADRNTCVLFGDGAGAAVVEWDPDRAGILSTYVRNDDDDTNALTCPTAYDAPQPFDKNGVSLEAMKEADPGLARIDEEIGATEAVAAGRPRQTLYMHGQKVFKFAVEALNHAVDVVLERAGLTIDDVSFIVPHQANERIIKYAAKKMKLPLDRFQISIAHRGNSSSACIPMTLSDAYEEGRIHPGDKVILVGFGGGFTSGAILYEA